MADDARAAGANVQTLGCDLLTGRPRYERPPTRPKNSWLAAEYSHPMPVLMPYGEYPKAQLAKSRPVWTSCHYCPWAPALGHYL